MLSLYRHVWIVILYHHGYVADLTECLTGEPLHTSASSSRQEGLAICRDSAKAVIDHSCGKSADPLRVAARAK